MQRQRLATIGLAIGLTFALIPTGHAQQVRRHRLDGHAGGPYKVVAADLTGDKQVDPLLAYHPIGKTAADCSRH